MEKEIKLFAINDCKAIEEDGVVVLKGYANTKNKADRYGDIPTVFKPLRDYVYELKEFKKNPVMLLDHWSSVSNIAGSFKVIKEDEKGLYFEAEFSNSDLPEIKHAREIYLEGHAKALSIGGRWSFEDKDNSNHLTLAEIYEISLVAVPADPRALAEAMEKKLKELNKKTNHTLKDISAEIDELKTLKDINSYLKDCGLSKPQTEGVMAKMRDVIKESKSQDQSKSESEIAELLTANIKLLKTK